MPAIGLAVLPECQCQFERALVVVVGAARDRPALPVEDHVDGGVGAQPFDFAQPIEMIAVRAAAEAMIVVAIDVQAGRVVLVERASDLAVDRPLADQVRQRNARQPLSRVSFAAPALADDGRRGRDRYRRECR